MFLKHYCLVKKYNKLAVNGQWTGQDLLCYIYTMLESDKKKKSHNLSQCCSKIGKKFVKSLWIIKICNDNWNFTNFHSIRKQNVEANFAKLRFSEIFMKFWHFLIMIFFRISLSRLYTDAAADVEGLTWPSISSIWHWGGNDLRFKNAFTHFFDVTHCTQWMGSMPQYNEKAIWALIIHVVPSLIKERLFKCL